MQNITTVTSTEITHKGLTLHLYKIGRILYGSLDGNRTSEMSTNEVFGTVSNDFLPIYHCEFSVINGATGDFFSRAIISSTSGNITILKSSSGAGTYYRGAFTYITAN